MEKRAGVLREEERALEDECMTYTESLKGNGIVVLTREEVKREEG